MFILKGRKAAMNCLAFSPDNRILAASGYRGVLQLWDLDRHQLSKSRTVGPWNNSGVFFMPDGNSVVVLQGHALYQFDMHLGHLGKRPKNDKRYSISAVTASANQQHVSMGFGYDRGHLEQYTLPDFTLNWTQPLHVQSGVTALTYSGDGRLLGCGLRDGEITVRDTLTGQVRYEPDGANSEVKAIALSPAGQYIAWSAATQLHLWRLHPLEQILRYSLGRTFFLSIAWHPSGDFFATANGDGKVDYWDGRTGEHRQAFDWGVGKLHDIVFDSTGDRAACGARSGEIVVWDVDR